MLRDKIFKLRSAGKSYRQIEQLLGCSKSTIAYHCSSVQKEKTKTRKKNRKNTNAMAKKVDNFKSRKMKNKVEKFACRSIDKKENKNYKASKLTFTWQEVLTKFEENPVCYLTGDKLDLSKPSQLSLDHKIPVSKGGNNTLCNLGFTSHQANQSKSDMTVEEYLELCKKVLKNFGYVVIAPK